jgi:hypothetical protein
MLEEHAPDFLKIFLKKFQIAAWSWERDREGGTLAANTVPGFKPIDAV